MRGSLLRETPFLEDASIVLVGGITVCSLDSIFVLYTDYHVLQIDFIIKLGILSYLCELLVYVILTLCVYKER